MPPAGPPNSIFSGWVAFGDADARAEHHGERRKLGTDHKIPVVFYSQLMAVAFGMDPNADAALDQNVIPATKLEKMAKK